MPSYGISHEAGTLKRVLVHHPGKELELANSDPIVHHFDQPVDIDRFVADHRELMDALEGAGVEVIDVGSLVSDDTNMSREVELPQPGLHTRQQRRDGRGGHPDEDGAAFEEEGDARHRGGPRGPRRTDRPPTERT